MKQLSITLLTLLFALPTVYAQKYTSYLFAFFSNNSPEGEQIRFAISDDGFNYRSLNDGKPVVASDTISLKKSIRDPHIIRAQDGKTFYMVLTDMRSSQGWQSNDGLVLMKSTDLIHWQHTAIDFPTRFPHLAGFDRANLHAVWAPQTIWDPIAKKYMIYYSIGRHDWEYETNDWEVNRRTGERKKFNQPYFKLFYSYATKTSLTSAPPVFSSTLAKQLSMETSSMTSNIKSMCFSSKTKGEASSIPQDLMEVGAPARESCAQPAKLSQDLTL